MIKGWINLRVDQLLCFDHVGLQIVAKRIVGAKWGSCSGQACIAIDYVLVEEKFASHLVMEKGSHSVTFSMRSADA